MTNLQMLDLVLLHLLCDGTLALALRFQGWTLLRRVSVIPALPTMEAYIWVSHYHEGRGPPEQGFLWTSTQHNL
jgi:hypothetical protein